MQLKDTTLTQQTTHYPLTKQSIEAVTPVERDGVRFYCSVDGSKVGLSQSGIARLAGVGESAIRALVSSVVSPQRNRSVPLPSSLIPFAEQDIYLPLSAPKQERIIRADVASAVVEYYAFESPKRNDMAVFAFRQFARKGMDAWIKEVVGYKDSSTVVLSEEASTNDVLLLVVQELKELRGQLALTSGYRMVAPEMPGLVQLTSGYQVDSPKSVAYAKAEEGELYSQAEWVALMGYKPLSNSDVHSMALILTGLYSSMFLAPPEKVLRKNANGVSVSGVAGYPRRHFPLLMSAYQQLQATKAAKKLAAEAKRQRQASRVTIHAPVTTSA